jgi:hypothetical protein
MAMQELAKIISISLEENCKNAIISSIFDKVIGPWLELRAPYKANNKLLISKTC